MDITVSDHALVRYLERVVGIDVEAIKDVLVTEGLMQAVQIAGEGVYPADGFNICVKRKNGAEDGSYVVATVYKKIPKRKRKR